VSGGGRENRIGRDKRIEQTEREQRGMGEQTVVSTEERIQMRIRRG